MDKISRRHHGERTPAAGEGGRRRKHPAPPDWRKVSFALSFGLPAVIMAVMFILREIYPFGDRSFLFSDMYHQYMPFFSEFMDKIKGGEGLAYSFNVGIGSNFLALYVYYLASPLHWLAFLFPKEHLMEFMSYLVIVKIGLCGLTSCIYLREHSRTRDVSILFFSSFYALSGFMAAYNWNIMWLDCVILLPLILLGLERLVKEGRCILYCVALGLSIFTNYYISIMICIFLVLYFVVLLVTEKRSLRILGNFALYSILAAGMSAVLLVPEVCAILETDFGDMNFPKKLESYFSVLDMLGRHCLNVAAERGLDHWPNIYCGVGVFLLIPLYAVNHKISIRRRFAYLALAGVLLVGFSTNMADFIWHGLNYPDSLPARQSFIYILLVLTMCYEAFRALRELEERWILYVSLAALAFLLFCEKFMDTEHFSVGIELVTVLFVVIYAVLLYLYRTREGRRCKEWLFALALVAVAAETGINTFNTSVGTVSRSSYLDELKDYRYLAERAQKLEDGFFRFEKFTRKTKNDGTLAGYPTASLFSSTMNSYVADLYKKWGMRYSKVFYGYDGATAFTSALLNVKFLFGEDESFESDLYRILDKSGRICLYACEAALPFGYTAPYGYDLPKGFNDLPLLLQNRMVNDLGVEGSLFVETDSAQNQDTVRLDAEQAGHYYMVVTASGTSKIKAEGSFGTRSFNDLKKGAVIYLGYLEEGSGVRLTNDDEDDKTPELSLTASRMDEQVLEQALKVLSRTAMTAVEYDTTHVNGLIEMKERGRLILSIPYESGWTVKVDGAETIPDTFGGTLIALDLEAGSHTIVLSYVPEGKAVGIAVSAVSITAFGAIAAAGGVRRRKRRRAAGTEEKEPDSGPGGASERISEEASAGTEEKEPDSGPAGASERISEEASAGTEPRKTV